MFPFIRLFAPFRHYLVGAVFLALFAHQMSNLIEPQSPQLQTDDPRLADVVSYEDLLHQKAEQVLKRYGVSEHSIDLSVTLDHTTITTTTFDPGSENRATTRQLLSQQRSPDPTSPSCEGGTWQEEVSTSPRVRLLKVCVVLHSEQEVDHDELYRSLFYTLGIDLKRGDLLRLVQE